MEIERKYLIEKSNLESIPKTSFINVESILQAYLSYEPEVRIRKIHDSGETPVKYFLTVKSSGTLAREEYEIEISGSVFEELFKKSCSKALVKTRRKVDIGGGLTAEIDEYQDFNFITAEVEFNNLEQSDLFKKPSWFGDEITEDKSYKNKALAKRL